MTIIRSQNDIADASTADLVETYNALTGKLIKKFSSRAAGESQVANAILVAEDRAAHLGVPKGARPVAVTTAEAEAKKAAGAHEPPAAVASPKPLREKLAARAGDAAPHTPKPRDPSAPQSASAKSVVPTGGGEFRLQAASIRGQVMRFIEERHAESGEPVSMDAIAAAHGAGARGAVAALVSRGHLKGA